MSHPVPAQRAGVCGWVQLVFPRREKPRKVGKCLRKLVILFPVTLEQLGWAGGVNLQEGTGEACWCWSWGCTPPDNAPCAMSLCWDQRTEQKGSWLLALTPCSIRGFAACPQELCSIPSPSGKFSCSQCKETSSPTKSVAGLDAGTWDRDRTVAPAD